MKPAPTIRRQSGFTLIEVAMASLILVVAFIGLIEAVGTSSNMMDSARRQTLAAQIISHEIEQLRFQNWTAISALPTAQTTLDAAWASGTNYVVADTVTYNGAWYRCIQAGSGNTPSTNPPSNSPYWKVDTPPYANSMSTSGIALGATYSLTRSLANPDPATNLREVTFTVTWMVNTSRHDSSGNLLTFTYTRVKTAWFGKYGLNLTYQRS